jgi:hypothetical protein
VNEEEGAVEFVVEDVVELGDGRAESLGEILAWELGEIAEGVDSPHVANVQGSVFPCQMGELLGELEWEAVEHFLWNITDG